MGLGSESSSGSSQRRSSVSRIIRSFSQALGITKSQFDVEKIVSYKDGKFIMNNEELEKILKNGTDNEQIMAIQLLEEEMINIIYSKRLYLWRIIKSDIDLKREGSVRSECFKLLNTILKINEVPDSSINELFNDIYKNAHLNGSGGDRDAKLIVSCFHNLIKNVNELGSLNSTTGIKLNDLLNELFRECLDLDEEAQVLIISLISECIKKDPNLFTTEELEFLLRKIISINIKTLNLLTIKSFVDFFESYLLTNGKFIDQLYTIFSILGCANYIEEIDSITKCETFLDKLLVHEYKEKVLTTLCDVISCKYDDIHEHRIGDKPIIGCIRYLGYILKYLGDNNIVTMFFHSNLYYLFQSFLKVSKCKDMFKSIEILKFIDEILEKPYSIKGYYKYFIEQNLFWELINNLNWNNSENDIKYSYLVVQNELFNKLQILKINSYYKKKLIEYFEANYKILSSYNIEFVLNFYSENFLCVCGTSNWKKNCESIIGKYYSILPLKVLNILKNSFLQCISLKIDEPSLNFYINIICYLCIINVPFELTNDILDSLTEVIIHLDDKMFEKIIVDYFKEIVNSKDLNIEFMDKSIILVILKSIKDTKRMKFLVDELFKVTKSLKNESIIIYHLILITSVRCDEKGTYYFEKYKSFDFFPEYFINNQTARFDVDLSMNKVLELYIDILENSENMKHYIFICENIRNQLLNIELFNNDQGIDLIVKLFKLIISQIEEVYTFKFPILKKNFNIKILLINLLYGFFGYIGIVDEIQWHEILKSIIIEFKFASTGNKIEIINYLNICMFEIPQIMKSFKLSILKIIRDDISKNSDLFFSNLEILFNIVNDELHDEEREIIKGILKFIDDLKYDESCDFDYIKDFKVLNEIIESLINDDGEMMEKILKPKAKIRLINDDDGMMNQLMQSLKGDKISKYLNISDNIMDGEDGGEDDDDSITVLVNNDDGDDDDGNIYLGRKIIIQRIENLKYFNIQNYNFKYVIIINATIEEDNLIEYLKRLIQICSISTI